jgi:hypothetical protein
MKSVLDFLEKIIDKMKSYVEKFYGIGGLLGNENSNMEY